MKDTYYQLIKRAADIAFGAVGCVALVPVTAGVKLAFLATGDTAPIIYRQDRLGKDKKVFKIFKYRSMCPDAEAVLEELLKEEKYRVQWEDDRKIENDPRVTKLGAVLRKTSIDELPQFINVLKGDMSLVGPRPVTDGELERHGGTDYYFKVKPGITGWWGCNGRSINTYEERLELEYYYIKNCSLKLDLICIFKTVGAVLRREGAW